MPKKAKPNQAASPASHSWRERSRGYLYRPTLSDLGRLVRLDVTPARADSTGDTVTIISKVVANMYLFYASMNDQQKFMVNIFSLIPTGTGFWYQRG